MDIKTEDGNEVRCRLLHNPQFASKCSSPANSNGYKKAKPLYVILSGENRKAVCEVELLRVERSEQARSEKHFVFKRDMA